MSRGHAIVISDVWRKQSKAKPFSKPQALFINKSFDSRNLIILIQVPNSWFPYKTLILIKTQENRSTKGIPFTSPRIAIINLHQAWQYWIPIVLPLVLFSDVWRKQSKARPFSKPQALFINKNLDSRNLIQLPNSWFPSKTLIKKETRKQVHKGYPLYKPQNSNNKPAPGMAILNSNCASPGFVFRCLEKAK